MRRPIDGTEGSNSCKARRLNEMRRVLPHMSQSAMSAVIGYIQTHEVSDLPSDRRSAQRAISLSLPDTPYGAVLVEATLFGAPPAPNKTMMLVNPFAYLWNTFKQGGGFYEMVKQQLSKHSCTHDSPWRLAIYGDEIVPGNTRAPRTARTIWALYFAFVEFDLHLHAEDAWCPLAAEQSEGLKTVSGGMYQVCAVALRHFSAT